MTLPFIHLPRTRAVAGALVVSLLLGGARGALGQQMPENRGFVAVTFKSASAGEDGYIHGNVIIDYSFRICGGNVQVMYGVRPGSVQGSTAYWYQGHNYGVRSSWAPPTEAAFAAEIRVHFGAAAVWQRDAWPRPERDLGCGFGSQWITLGPISKFVEKAKTDREKQDLLNRFTFDVGITRAPMRSSAVESALARELAAARLKARQDSLEQVRVARVARADSLDRARAAQVRADSLERARAAQAAAARQSKATGTGRGQPSTRTAGAVPATSGSSSASGSSEAAQRQAREAAVRQRQADSIARQREAAAERQRQVAEVQRMLAERQAAQEARNQQVDQAAEQIGQLVGNIMQARAQDQARRAAREGEAMRRKEEYQLRARAAYLAAPERPHCTRDDARAALHLDSAVSGQLTLADCRLRDSTSAALYTFELDRPRAVTLTLPFAQFYGKLRLEDSAHVLARTDDGKPIERKLPAGRYLVAVSSEVPGETGAYRVNAHRSVLSKTWGLSFGLVLGGGTVAMEGADGSTNEAGLRVGLGIGPYVTALVQGATGANDQGAGMDYLEYGGRVYFKNMYERWRPFVHYAVGTRDYSVSTGSGMLDIDFYDGKGSTMGAGIEWFNSRRFGLEAGLYRASGKMQGSQDSAPARDLSSIRFTTGITFHK